MVEELKMVLFEDEDKANLQCLQKEKLFKRLTFQEFFALFLVYGKNQGFRTPLKGKKHVLLHEKSITDSNLDYLMMAIGVEEIGSLSVLSSNEYIAICEEYAKTGIHFLDYEYMENPKNFIKKLEMDALKYYDEHIEEK